MKYYTNKKKIEENHILHLGIGDCLKVNYNGIMINIYKNNPEDIYVNVPDQFAMVYKRNEMEKAIDYINSKPKYHYFGKHMQFNDYRLGSGEAVDIELELYPYMEILSGNIIEPICDKKLDIYLSIDILK